MPFVKQVSLTDYFHLFVNGWPLISASRWPNRLYSKSLSINYQSFQSRRLRMHMGSFYHSLLNLTEEGSHGRTICNRGIHFYKVPALGQFIMPESQECIYPAFHNQQIRVISIKRSGNRRIMELMLWLFKFQTEITQ